MLVQVRPGHQAIANPPASESLRREWVIGSRRQRSAIQPDCRQVRSLRARDVRPQAIPDVPDALRSNSETIKGEGKDGCVRLCESKLAGDDHHVKPWLEVQDRQFFALCVRAAVGDQRRRNASAP